MDVKRYTYYFYYYLDDEESGEIYAYTDHSDLAKEFERMRNMTKFKRRKRKISRREVNFLADEYPERYLKSKYLFTAKKGKQETTEIKVVMTDVESTTTENHVAALIVSDLWANVWTPVTIFCKELKQALKTIGYDLGYAFISETNEKIEINDGEWMDAILEILKVDEFAMFMYLFGYTIL